ncbi:hypothetical protein FBU30_001542 [Linnemannia zychae]|nr:hypothetical protein FBU30_001542 [Linnemannia zychae]
MSGVISTLAQSDFWSVLGRTAERYLVYIQTQSRFKLTITAFCVLLIGTMLKYPDRAIGTRSRKDLPGDRGWPLIGNLFHLLRYKENTLEYHMSQFKKHGNVYTFTLPNLGRAILINSPDLIEYVQKTNFDNYSKGDPTEISTDLFGHGIFVSNGAAWRMQRKTASNVFTTRFFRDLVQYSFKECAQELGDNFTKYESRATADGLPYYFDLQQELAKMTLDTFGRIALGLNFKAMSKEDSNDFGSAFDFMTRRIELRTFNPFWRLTEQLVPSLRHDVRHSIDTLNGYAYTAITDRRKETPEKKEMRRKDLLDFFVDYEYEDGTKLNDDQLRDVFMNFMIAGRDTTSQALAWMFYHLMKHPEIEANMRKEIEAIFPNRSNDYTYELLTRDMPYVKAVFYETLRLFPPVSISGLFALGPDTLPNGTRIETDDFVLFSAYCMGRETDVWGPNASEFYPERWLQHDSETKSPFGKFKNENSFKFNSFNGGPRICLGQQFATLEAMVTTIYILQNFRFELKPDHPTPVPLPALTTPIQGGLFVRVFKRHGDE